MVPGIGVLIQDSLLLHARNLILFFENGGRSTDITLSDFTDAPVNSQLLAQVKQFKFALHVHLMHLTAWRDPTYRSGHSGSENGAIRQRPDWNEENARIVTALMSLLADTSTKSDKWNPPLAELHCAADDVLADGHAKWPTELGEREEILSYLKGHGL